MNKNYKIYDFYGESYPHSDWNAKLARKKINELIKLKEERLKELINLLDSNNINLDYSKESLQQLNNFICKELEDYMPKLDKSSHNCCNYVETQYFRSLVIDCTLYLGEVLLISLNSDKLKWDVYKTTKKEFNRFYPSIHNTIFASDIYIYFVQYLGGFDSNNKMLIQLYNESYQYLQKYIDLKRRYSEN